MLIEEGVKHYCLNKDLSRLLSSQATKSKRKEYFCMRCLNPFGCHEALNRHLENCSKYKAVKIKMPKEGTILKFKNYDRREKVPFIVYADFECFIKPLQSFTQMIKRVILNITKNTSHLAFVTISNASMMKYINQN